MAVAEIGGIVALVVVLVILSSIAVRRAILVRAGGFGVSWRLRPGADDRGWILGQARFRRGQLALYRSISPWPAAALSLDRAAVVLGQVRPRAGAEPDLLPVAAVIVEGSCAGTPFELALSVDALTALRSWVESRPPGSRMPSRGQGGGSVGESPFG